MINGKSYIGQSINPYRRFVSHCSRAKNDSDNSPIHAAIKKYGKNNFNFEILEWTKDYNVREQELIIEHKTYSPYGYNIVKGGEEPPHYYGEDHFNSKITDAQVQQIIKMLKDNKLTEPEIAKTFDPPLNQVMINSINWGVTHKQEKEDYPIRKECPYNLNAKEVEEIKWLLKYTSFPCYQIADYYHVTTSTIKHINAGRNYREDNIIYPIRKNRGKKQVEPVETILAKRSTNAIDTHSEMGVCAEGV